MTVDAGDLVVLPSPYTDLSSAKQRPALVLSPSWYNGSRDDALFAYVTSVPRPEQDPFALPLSDRDLESGSLVKDSWVRADKLFTIDQALIRKTVARLNGSVLAAVRALACALVRGEQPGSRPRNEQGKPT